MLIGDGVPSAADTAGASEVEDRGRGRDREARQRGSAASASNGHPDREN